MRWVLDACCLIYLGKANLLEKFLNFTRNRVIIDNHVYKEAIVDGKANKYRDAEIIESCLKKYQVPIIPVDIHDTLPIYIDPGESSCAVLTDDNSTTITSDVRAFKKFLKNNIKVQTIDMYFYSKHKKKKLNENEFFQILFKLEKINAISAKTIILYKKLLEMKNHG
ncbi:MAG: hypothetical protein ACTSYS_05750 [Promethearchaeota archaeon]